MQKLKQITEDFFDLLFPTSDEETDEVGFKEKLIVIGLIALIILLYLLFFDGL